MKNKCITHNDLVLMVLLVIEFLLFCTYTNREISNMIPSDVDQSVYLNSSYSIYKDVLECNYLGAIKQVFSISNTGLPVLGVLLFFLFGQSRLILLMPNFFGFAALQIVGYRITNRVFKNEYVGMSFVGLLLLTNTTFGWAANLVSFRADFLFACAFSMWIMLFFEAIWQQDNKVLFVSALVAGFMLFIRFFAICFLVPIVLVELLMYFQTCKDVRKTLKHLFNYVGGVLLGGGWFFLINIINFVKYYLDALTGGMKEIWQTELSFIENVFYYPGYFVSYHLGKDLAISLLLVGIFCGLLYKIKKCSIDKQLLKAEVILLVGFLVPYIFLMISNKQPLVISLWNGIFIFSILLIVSQVYVICKHKFWGVFFKFLSVLLIIVGFGEYLSNTTRTFLGAYATDDDVDEVWELNAKIVAWGNDNDDEEIDIVLDRWNDVLSLETLELSSVEVEGKWLDFKYAIDCMNSNFATIQFDEKILGEGLDKAEVIVVAKDGYNYTSTFPTDHLLDSYRDNIYTYAVNNLQLLDRCEYRGNEIQVYVRRNVSIAATWSDWLSIETMIDFVKEDDDSLIVLEGPYMEGVYPELLVRAVDENNETLEVDAEVINGRYKISIDVSALPNKEVSVKLISDSYFIPSEMSESPDTRTLAILYPDKCIIQKGEE